MKGKKSSGKPSYGNAANTVGSERKHGGSEHSGSLTKGGSHKVDHGTGTATGPMKSKGSNGSE